MKITKKYVGYFLIILAVLLVIATFVTKAELEEQSTYMCILIEQTPDVSMEECPAHSQKHTWALMISFGIAITLLLGGGYLLFPQQQEKKKKTAITNLTPEEKEIYQKVQENESCFQSDLVRETSYSKVKVTRLLDKLEQKGLIERRRRGMTNIIFIKE